MREQSPEKFFHRLVNQLWYGIVGWKEIWTPHCTNLKEYIKIKADGMIVELPEDTEGLIFCNIPSFGGGMKLWGNVNQYASGSLSAFLKGSSVSAIDTASLVHQDMDYLSDARPSNLLRNRKVKSSPSLYDMKNGKSSSNLGLINLIYLYS